MRMLNGYVYVLYDFEASHDDEISIRVGERIEVLKKDEEFGDGWWEGRNPRGTVGIFPANYTSPHRPDTPTTSAPATPRAESSSTPQKPTREPTQRYRPPPLTLTLVPPPPIFSAVASSSNATPLTSPYSLNTTPLTSPYRATPLGSPYALTPLLSPFISTPLLSPSIETPSNSPRLPSTGPSTPSTLPLDPQSWSTADVVAWLGSRGFDNRIQNTFAEHDISGDVLLLLDKILLKEELGICAYGQRVRLLNAIQELKRLHEVGPDGHLRRVGTLSSPPPYSE